MKLLVVSQYFWPEEFRINDICIGMKEKGHEVEVLTGLPNYPEGELFEGYKMFNRKRENFKGIDIKRVPLIPRGKNSSIKLILNYISFMFTSVLATPKFLFNNYDSIFAFQLSPITSVIPAIIVSKVKKTKSVIYVQDLWPESFFSIVCIKNKPMEKIAKKLCSLIYKSFDEVLITSKGFRDKLIEKGVNEDKITYFPQWAENMYENIEDNRSINEFVITFAGNIGKAQSVETIVEAAKITKEKGFRNIKWNILGDGSEFENITNMVNEYKLNDNVILFGRKPSTDMPTYFSKSDALLVTLKDTELFNSTLPAKVQAYMASGKPIIGAISGEGKLIMEEARCGLCGEAENFKTLSDNVIKLSKLQKEDREIMGKNAKKFFDEHFSREKLLNQLENILFGENTSSEVYIDV